MEVGKKYSFKGKTYVYHGEWISSSESSKPGIYKRNGKIKSCKRNIS